MSTPHNREQTQATRLAQLKQAAAEGDLKARFELGILNFRGAIEGAKPSFGLADIFNVAQSGYAEAQYYLGALYDDGISIQRDLRQARKWYQAAAEQGYADAMRELAEMYKKGKGGKKDHRMSLYWQEEFLKAIADDPNYSDEEKGFFEYM
ncbi:MAG: hypothetical protein SNG49_09635 [Rikenellaceae bacterium]